MQTRRQQIGTVGEKIAASYLKGEGFNIIAQNYRNKYGEIDIIATKEKQLHIIEVKIRAGYIAGIPEDLLTKRKVSALRKAAIYYVRSSDAYFKPEQIQIDLIAIQVIPNFLNLVPMFRARQLSITTLLERKAILRITHYESI